MDATWIELVSADKNGWERNDIADRVSKSLNESLTREGVLYQFDLTPKLYKYPIYLLIYIIIIYTSGNIELSGLPSNTTVTNSIINLANESLITVLFDEI